MCVYKLNNSCRQRPREHKINESRRLVEKNGFSQMVFHTAPLFFPISFYKRRCCC